jgi:Leucine-rich repeat (LRR) protein
MSTDLGIIKKIEKKYNKKIKNFDKYQFYGGAGYRTDYDNNIIFLSLYELNISDYSFLEELTNLNDLDLSSNNLNNISFIKKISNITKLNLSGNQITDYSFLKLSLKIVVLYRGTVFPYLFFHDIK